MNGSAGGNSSSRMTAGNSLPRVVEIEGRFVTFFPPKDAAYLMGDFTD